LPPATHLKGEVFGFVPEIDVFSSVYASDFGFESKS
jgi:hypothetical protein